MDLETLTPPRELTRSERIRLLQQEADDEINHMLMELQKGFNDMDARLVELAGVAKNARPAVASLVNELRPQVARWSDIANAGLSKAMR
jgi:hypothetical protein